MIHCPETEFATLATLRECWSQAARKLRSSSEANPLTEDLHTRISNEMLPMLVHLLHERRGCDCTELIETVRRIVIDHQFYENAANPEQWQINVDQQVALILQVLQTTRKKLFSDGEWSCEPVPPMMFG